MKETKPRVRALKRAQHFEVLQPVRWRLTVAPMTMVAVVGMPIRCAASMTSSHFLAAAFGAPFAPNFIHQNLATAAGQAVQA